MDWLCCPSEAVQLRADMTREELDKSAFAMISEYRKLRSHGNVKANRLTESIHAKLETFYVEELEKFIQHIGCARFRVDAFPEDIGQYDLLPEERAHDYKCPLTPAAREYSAQLDKYWAKVVKYFQSIVATAERKGWRQEEIQVAKNRVKKAEHLWKNCFLCNYIGLQMNFPEPILTSKLLKGIHKMLQPVGDGIAMVSTLYILTINLTKSMMVSRCLACFTA